MINLGDTSDPATECGGGSQSSARGSSRRPSVSMASFPVLAVAAAVVVSGAMARATSAFVVTPPSVTTAHCLSTGRNSVFSPEDATKSCSYARSSLVCAPSSHSRTTSTQKAVSTALSMVAKSGGREILSVEQFNEEVLCRGADSDDDPATENNEKKPRPKPVLAFYSAPWCGPCRLSNPVVKDVMKQFAAEIDVVEICTDDLAEVAAEAGVVSIPTIQIFYKGELLDTIVGCVARNVLASSIMKVLEEDVDQEDEEDVEEEEEEGEEDT